MTIKELRAASNMTQKAFAEYIGVNKSTVEKWEYGNPDCPEYVRALIEYKLKGENKIVKKTVIYVREVVHYPYRTWDEYFTDKEAAEKIYEARDLSRNLYINDGGTIETTDFETWCYGNLPSKNAYNKTPEQLTHDIFGD